MKNDSPEHILKLFGKKHSLEELINEYPDEWEEARLELSSILESGKAGNIKASIESLAAEEAELNAAIINNPGNKKILGAARLKFVKNRMLQLAIKDFCLAAAAGAPKGKVRFNLLNGYVLQKLLFSKGLERKPVSMFWFRLLWPLIGQKNLLMPLVQPKGIYCFYSRSLIDELAEMIGKRSCVEIAAGDGTLARFLKARGVPVTATDDHSWKHNIEYPEAVINMNAGESIARYSPEVVLCSWPPAKNAFERAVFGAPSVSLYIVIGSRHQFASGNFEEYTRQTAFTFEEDKKLSRLVLPPELESAVYVFRRKNA